MSKDIGQIIRGHRLRGKIPLRKLASELDVDQATLSKAERGLKTLSDEHIRTVERFFSLSKGELLNHYLSDKIALMLVDSSDYTTILELTLQKIQNNNPRIDY